MNFLLYFILIAQFELVHITPHEGLWLPQVSSKKVKKEIYSIEIPIYNSSKDTAYFEVPYPYSLNISLAENYFNNIQSSKVLEKEFYNVHFNGDSIAPNMKILVQRDFIAIPPSKNLLLKFNVRAQRKFRKIALKFRYSFTKVIFNKEAKKETYLKAIKPLDIWMNL
jgi:hypothetical protein